MLFGVAIVAAIIWLGLLAQPWQPWRMRERFVADADDADGDLSDTTVLIPARDEAETLGRTLAALAHQGRGLRVIVIDDHSGDGTAAVARRAGLLDLDIIAAAPLPPGWTGKLWALEQGREHVTTARLLLLDADIEIAPGTIAGLRARAIREDRQLVSLMAALRMHSTAERLLMPAFIYFFKLLYPFALSNAGSRFVAAAAGGCVLLDARVLDAIGGFASLRDAVIDDCTLAARVRAAGGRTWVGVTHAAVSLRGYDDFASIHAMVARSAFTQLRYSRILLAACTLVMAVMFWVPPLALLVGDAPTRAVAALALLAMLVSYLPTLRYYRLRRAWALLLPVTGTLYLGMTWSSALRYWRGLRTAWRGREYRRDENL
ncbi:glycosyltransferase [Salinisphaera aquimarina]|uniref:Glycosyltransferase n=1 Tax=Salinisphaera aquimarina TaxID=2094031 RepID=A0ABV7ET68_9GAMM